MIFYTWLALILTSETNRSSNPEKLKINNGNGINPHKKAPSIIVSIPLTKIPSKRQESLESNNPNVQDAKRKKN